jgi:hypothetical protein
LESPSMANVVFMIGLLFRRISDNSVITFCESSPHSVHRLVVLVFGTRSGGEVRFAPHPRPTRAGGGLAPQNRKALVQARAAGSYCFAQ